MEEDEQEVLEIISHVTEDFLGIEEDKQHKSITEQTLKDGITLEAITEHNSKDNFAEDIVSEIINELVGSVQERTLKLSEIESTSMFSETGTNQPKPASEVTDVIDINPQQSIRETAAEDISYIDNQKVANNVVEDEKAEPEHNEISSLVAKDGKLEADTEDNYLKDGTKTVDKEYMVWNL